MTLRLANAPTDTALVLQTSGNLVDWVSLRTNSVPEGFLDLRDESYHQDAARFYRVMAVH